MTQSDEIKQILADNVLTTEDIARRIYPNTSQDDFDRKRTTIRRVITRMRKNGEVEIDHKEVLSGAGHGITKVFWRLVQ